MFDDELEGAEEVDVMEGQEDFDQEEDDEAGDASMDNEEDGEPIDDVSILVRFSGQRRIVRRQPMA